jgi:hypothetical protein
MNRILATLCVGLFLFPTSAGIAEAAQPGRYLPITYWPPGYILTEKDAAAGYFSKEYPAAKLPPGFSYSRVYLGGQHSIRALTSQEAAEKSVAFFITHAGGKPVALGDSGGAQVRETANQVQLRAFCRVKNVIISVDINQWEFKPPMSRGGRAPNVTLVPKPSPQEVMDLARAWVTAATAYARDQGLFSGTPGIGQTPQVTQAKVQSVEPIVVVVHGIGFDETRSSGWSKWMSESWGLSPLEEVTHNPAHISDSINWIKPVRRRFEEILAQSKREKRPVIIVSHSWGAVMSKLALNGGRIEEGAHKFLVVKPMQEQGWVDLWITLNSPLQINGKYAFWGEPTVIYGSNKPPQAKRWSNFYDEKDSIGSASGSLVDIPMNVGLQADKAAFYWYLTKSGIDPGFESWTGAQIGQNAGKFQTALLLKKSWPHIGIWYHPTVKNYIRNQYAALKQDAEAALLKQNK